MTRQEYYEHLLRIGFPELLAATMANQSDYIGRTNVTKNFKSEVYSFTRWSETIEGTEFWSRIIDCLK